jgi:hypothetical protein
MTQTIKFPPPKEPSVFDIFLARYLGTDEAVMMNGEWFQEYLNRYRLSETAHHRIEEILSSSGPRDQLQSSHS